MAVHSSSHFHLKMPVQVESALKKAAEITGADFQYLVDTAARESGFRPSVKAPTSSATGLFQFIESTWLEVVKNHGAAFGLKEQAAAISQSRSGRYFVADKGMRREILELRKDPEIAAVMAGVFTQNNAKHLEAKLKRHPTAGELYIAHFLGAGNGGRLVKAAQLNPGMKAADLFPSAARANKTLFYRRGEALSVKALYHNLVRRHQALSKPMAVAGVASSGQPHQHLEAKSWARGMVISAVEDTQRASSGPLFNLKQFHDQAAHSRRAESDRGSKIADAGDVVAGQIGIWGQGGDQPAKALSRSGRVQQSLARAEHRGQPEPLLDLSGGNRDKARRLFVKGGLG